MRTLLLGWSSADDDRPSSRAAGRSHLLPPQIIPRVNGAGDTRRALRRVAIASRLASNDQRVAVSRFEPDLKYGCPSRGPGPGEVSHRPSTIGAAWRGCQRRA